MVVFDTSVLVLVSDPFAKPPLDPSTRAPVTECQERMLHLIKTLTAEKQRVLIGTPVLAEYLVRAGADKDKRFQEITKSSVFSVASFDIRAAVECAALEDKDTPKARPVPDSETKAKVKFDRQIIAIAISRGAETIYTGDDGLASRARRSGLKVVMPWEIPLPPVDAQLPLRYEADASFDPLIDAEFKDVGVIPTWGAFGRANPDK